MPDWFDELTEAVEQETQEELDWFDSATLPIPETPEFPIQEIGQIQETAERGVLAETAAAVARGFLQMGEGVMGGLNKLSAALESVIPLGYVGYTPETPDKEFFRQVERNIESAQKRLPRTREGVGGWVINTLGESAPQLMASIATAGYSKLIPFVLIGLTEGEQSYNEAKLRGAPESEAVRDYALTGTISGALEMWGVSQILKVRGTTAIARKALLDNIRNRLWVATAGNLKTIGREALQTAAIEGLEEWSQTVGGQHLVAALPGGIDLPRKPDNTIDWKEVIRQQVLSAAGGALVGGIVGPITPVNIPETTAIIAERNPELAETISTQQEIYQDSGVTTLPWSSD